MDQIANVITGFAGFLLNYAVVLAAAGALAMALVELFKKLHDARTRFHARATTRWFLDSECANKASAFGQLLHLAAGIPQSVAVTRAEELLKSEGRLSGLLWLASDRRDAVFALEVEKMMSCVQDSLDLALTSPTLYQDLFEFITDAATLEDRQKWLIESALAAGTTPPSADAMKVRAERYARLRQAAKRKVDAFQTFTSMRWVNQQQLWANVLGTVTLGAAFATMGVRGELRGADVVPAILFSLLGGMLAPIAKDLVVALQQVREPRS